MNTRHCLVAIAITSFVIGHVNAQDYAVRKLDARHGLPSRVMYTTHVDRSGYLWISTPDGLCRWDGRQMKTFLPRLDDPKSMIHQKCWGIEEDSLGDLYFITANGIATFNPGLQAFHSRYVTGRRSDDTWKFGTSERISDTLCLIRVSGIQNHIVHLPTLQIGTMMVEVPVSRYTVPAKGYASCVSDRMGVLWATTQYGLARRSPTDSAFRVVHPKLTSNSQKLDRIMRTIDGRVAWMLSLENGGVGVIDLEHNGILSDVALPREITSSTIVAMQPVSSSRCVLITLNGTLGVIERRPDNTYAVEIVQMQDRFRAHTNDHWSADAPEHLIVDHKERIWFSGMNGLFRIDVQNHEYSFHQLIRDDEPSDAPLELLPVHVDGEGRITAVQRLSGIVIADPTRPSAASVSDLNEQIDRVIGLDGDRSMIFLGSGSADIAIVNVHNKSASYYNLRGSQLSGVPRNHGDDRQRSLFVRGTYRSKDGTIWVGTYQAVLAIDPVSLSVRRYDIATGAGGRAKWSDIIQAFGEMYDGTLWAFSDYGSYRLDRSSGTFVFISPVGEHQTLTLNNAILGIMQSTKGKTWVYGHSDVGRLNNNGSVEPLHLHPSNTRIEPLSSILYATMLSVDQAILVDRRGIAIADLTKRSYLRITSPFVEAGRQPYLDARRDAHGVLWLVTSTHIECYDQTSQKFRLVPLESQEGQLQYRTARIAVNGAASSIWLEHLNGVSVYSPQQLPAIRTALSVEFTAIRVNDTLRALSPWLQRRDTVELEYEASPFSIHFSVIDPSYGNYLRYRYILEGSDAHWIETDGVAVARYQNVGHGTYRFRVQVFDVDGQWKEPRRPLTIIIQPAWWQRVWFKLGTLVMVSLLGWGAYRSRVRTITVRNYELERQVRDRTRLLEAEQERSDSLLLNVLPEQVARRLKNGEREIADSHTNASVLFADLVGFTPLTSSLTPSEIVKILNELFSRFDRLARTHGVERIKTIGDGYMAASGVPISMSDHAVRMVAFAVDMLDTMNSFAEDSGYDLHLRIGINCGDVVAAVVGESRFAYDLWGDTVNVAARMESYGASDRIHCTQAFIDALGSVKLSRYAISPRGSIEIKGKGIMETYWIDRCEE